MKTPFSLRPAVSRSASALLLAAAVALLGGCASVGIGIPIGPFSVGVGVGSGGVNLGVQDSQVQRALLDMSTAAQIKDSLTLGNSLLREIGSVGRLHKPRVEQAGFAVLKAPDIPSVLVETAFISNPEEEEKLRSEAYQKQLTDALMRGILQYFSRNPPLARNRSI